MKTWTLRCALLALLTWAAACTHEVLPPEKFASATADSGGDSGPGADGGGDTGTPEDGVTKDAAPEQDTDTQVEPDVAPDAVDTGEPSDTQDTAPDTAMDATEEVGPDADTGPGDAGTDAAVEETASGDAADTAVDSQDTDSTTDAADTADAATSDTAGPNCATLCDDSNLCTTDDCDGESCVHINNALPCQDGDLCTTGDVCEAGKCKPGAPKVCDDGNVCTDDLCKSGAGCTLANNVTPCSDNDPCTLADACAGGACKAGLPNPCDDDNDCTNDSCVAGSGCKHTNIGALCDDGDACTVGDSCASGKCTPGSKKTCDDGNPCTNDACDPKAGCTATPNTATCDDKNACTDGDICAKGSCQPGDAANCDDANVCTTDSCNASSGCVHGAAISPCDDTNKCTTGDTCANKACTGGPAPNCDDANECTTDSCSPSTGCVHTPVADNTACNDGNGCTNVDKCTTGKCVGSGGKDCDDKNPCTLDTCANDVCGHSPSSAPCDDGDACTTGDVCGSAECGHTGSLDCNDGNPCTDDSCNKTNGCAHTNNSANCDDGNKCTEQDRCAAGACSESVAKVCDDGKVCTDNACDPASGNCSYPNNSASCDDGSKCTTIDTCVEGSCKGTQVVDCNDDNPCTDDSCDANAGCQHKNNTVACDDGSVCTTSDTCGSGKCTGTAVTCSDGNLCTDDGCDAVTGCKYTNNSAPCDDGNECTASSSCAGGTCSVAVNVADGTTCGGSQDKGCSSGTCTCKLYAANAATSSSYSAVAADFSGGTFLAGTVKDAALGTIGFVDHRDAFNVSTAGGPVKLTTDKAAVITVNNIAGSTSKGLPFWAVASNDTAKISNQPIVYSITDNGVAVVGKPTGSAGLGDFLYGATMLSDGSAVMVGMASATYTPNGLLPSGDSKLPQGWILKYAKGGSTPAVSKLYKSGFGLALRSTTRLINDSYVMAVGWQYITDSKGTPATTPTWVIDQACAVIIDTSTGTPQPINGGAAIQVANHNTTGNTETELWAVALESTSGSTAKVIAGGRVRINGTMRPLLWRATVTYSGGAWSLTQDASATLSTSAGMVNSVVGLGGTYAGVFGNIGGYPFGGRIDTSTCGFSGTAPVCSAPTWSKTSSSTGDVKAATLLSSGYLMAVGQQAGLASLTVAVPSTGSNSCP